MKMKKIAAALTAATILGSNGALVVSASAETNAVNITTSTVTEAIATADGTIIPEGAKAISLEIQNNTGFDISEIKLNVNTSLLSDASGMPIVSVGNVCGDSTVVAAQEGGNVAITSIASSICNADGVLATVYVNNTASIAVEDAEFRKGSLTNYNESGISSYAETVEYTIGDVNGDGNITADDAYIARNAFAIAQKNGELKRYGSSSYYYLDGLDVLSDPQKYGFTRVRYAIAADGDENYRLFDCDLQSLSDVYQILYYYTCTSIGKNYNVSGWYIGEERTF
ncbi:hypothetical protein [uncultured Ruminococcus sp.]|uniref:hypothetical protein n=1 Tax=uncultured Ruminococcus sp. TaxID=165186 RepID=UPI0026034820|nr:hypothetical protein [uncultured Ruminococcus sp.]